MQKTYPKAAKCLKLFMVAMLLTVIGALITVISVIVTIAAALNLSLEGAAGGLVATGISGVLMIILMIVAVVLQFIGIIIARNDHNRFRLALVLVLIALLTCIVSGVTTGVVSAIFTWAYVIFDLFAVLCIFDGARQLLLEIGDTALAKKAMTIMVIYCITFFLSNVFSQISMVSTVGATIQAVLSVIDLVLTVIYAVMCISFLSKASKSLRGDGTAAQA